MNQELTLLKVRFFIKAELGQTEPWGRGHRLEGSKQIEKTTAEQIGKEKNPLEIFFPVTWND